jgi:putative tryptophan/tyrosine transport system substrate-binding protein
VSIRKKPASKYQKSWAVLAALIMIPLLLSSCSTAPTPKVYRVGILSGLQAFAPAAEGFKAKMTELGYVEGQNISYDVQSSDVDRAAYKRILDKFVADKVDLIFAFPHEAARDAKAATQGANIPVVFAIAFTGVDDLVKSVREPGGNITGSRAAGAELASKRLEILLELAPNVKRIFVPYKKDYPIVPIQLETIRPLAASKGVELVEYGSTTLQDLQAELDSFVTADSVSIDAILMIAEPLTVTPDFYSVLGKFSYDHKLPIGGSSINSGGKYATIFGLIPDAKSSGAQAAVLADKIFRGAAAGSIQVTTAETYFLINITAAQDLGVTVPEGLLGQADEIIR